MSITFVYEEDDEQHVCFLSSHCYANALVDE